MPDLETLLRETNPIPTPPGRSSSTRAWRTVSRRPLRAGSGPVDGGARPPRRSSPTRAVKTCDRRRHRHSSAFPAPAAAMTGPTHPPGSVGGGRPPGIPGACSERGLTGASVAPAARRRPRRPRGTAPCQVQHLAHARPPRPDRVQGITNRAITIVDSLGGYVQSSQINTAGSRRAIATLRSRSRREARRRPRPPSKLANVTVRTQQTEDLTDQREALEAPVRDARADREGPAQPARQGDDRQGALPSAGAARPRDPPRHAASAKSTSLAAEVATPTST